MLQNGLLISMTHSWIRLFWMPDMDGNMTNLCISSQEPASLSFFIVSSRKEHFLCFPEWRLWFIASGRMLTWTAEVSAPVSLLLPSFLPSVLLQGDDQATTTLPIQFPRVILAVALHTHPSHLQLQAFKPPGHKWDTVGRAVRTWAPSGCRRWEELCPLGLFFYSRWNNWALY